jgi:hypothetical protein
MPNKEEAQPESGQQSRYEMFDEWVGEHVCGRR